MSDKLLNEDKNEVNKIAPLTLYEEEREIEEFTENMFRKFSDDVYSKVKREIEIEEQKLMKKARKDLYSFIHCDRYTLEYKPIQELKEELKEERRERAEKFIKKFLDLVVPNIAIKILKPQTPVSKYDGNQGYLEFIGSLFFDDTLFKK